MKRMLLFLLLIATLICPAQEVQSPKPGITINGSYCLIGNLTLSCMPKTCDTIYIVAGDSVEFCTFQQISLNTDTAYWLQWNFYGATNLQDTIRHVYPTSVPLCHWPRWDTAGVFTVEVMYNGWLSAYPTSDCYQFGPSHWYITVDVAPNPNTVAEHASGTIMVYPNPCTDQLNIRSASEIESVRIIDCSGRLVLSSKLPEVDLSECADGIYIAEVTLANGSTIREHIVKQ